MLANSFTERFEAFCRKAVSRKAMGMNMPPFVVLLCRLALGSVWIAAATAKLLRRNESLDAITAFDLVPRRVAQPIGIGGGAVL